MWSKEARGKDAHCTAEWDHQLAGRPFSSSSWKLACLNSESSKGWICPELGICMPGFGGHKGERKMVVLGREGR